ncbi:MAG: exosome complex RNA-binding protein Csl4 [Candidatus Hodarchaeota archaeon]
MNEIPNPKKQDISSGTIVAPGDWLGVIEEFIPSEGTYEEDDGSIYASTGGTVVIDEHRIAVQSERDLELPVRGVKAIGQVTSVKKQIASIDLFKIGNRVLSIPISAILHISNSSHSYVRSMFDVVRPADWVYCVIIKPGVPTHVSTVGREYGVLKGLCNYCGSELGRFKTTLLKCTNCEEVQPRVVARDFGLIL